MDKIALCENRRVSFGCYWLLILLAILYFNGFQADYLPSLNSLTKAVVEFMFLGLLPTIIMKFKIDNSFLPCIKWLILFLAWGVITGLLNGASIINIYQGHRIALDLLLVMLYVYSANFNRREILLLIKFVAFLFVVQIPISAFNWLAYGRMECRVAAIAFGGGSSGTSFPLIAMAFGFGYYYYIKRNLRTLTVSLLFILPGLSNGKRAICILFPFFCIIGYQLYSYLSRSSAKMIKSMFLSGLFSIILFFCALFFLNYMGGFQDMQSEKTISEKTGAAYNKIMSYTYTKATDKEGRIGNRGDVVSLGINMIFKGFEDYWLGMGPMVCSGRDETGYSKYGIYYGAPQFVTDIITVGVPGMIFHQLFYFSILFSFRRIPFQTLNKLGKFLYFGSFISILSIIFINLYYSSIQTFTVSLQMIPCMALTLLFCKQYKKFFIVNKMKN